MTFGSTWKRECGHKCSREVPTGPVIGVQVKSVKKAGRIPGLRGSETRISTSPVKGTGSGGVNERIY